MQRVRHANRGRLLLRTPGPVPLWDLHVFLCRDQSLLNLSCLRTFEFRTPLGTSLLLEIRGYLKLIRYLFLENYIRSRQFFDSSLTAINFFCLKSKTSHPISATVYIKHYEQELNL